MSKLHTLREVLRFRQWVCTRCGFSYKQKPEPFEKCYGLPKVRKERK